ncbi:BTB/POZ domain-containing protein KCTD9 isoform X3 [Drosophila takahashii]|uniref:BTB/POZ domain-containing protein KCTD9 isoform X3 n=1 Tax=Drosophila takahashii TaxID=29030 RepID=UPI003898F1D8
MDSEPKESVSDCGRNELPPEANSLAAASVFAPNRWVKLNVGGQIYATTIDTLVGREPDSMLARMFLQDGSMMPSERDEKGAFLIDRSPRYFEPIINYLRHGQFVCDSNISVLGVLEEARFFGIYSLVTHLEERLGQQEAPMGDRPLTRNDVIKAIIQTSVITELRFQGVNLSGADLRKLDFRNINFKYANMSHCNLSHTNLSHTCLERADLQYANLECAQLVSVRGLCANMILLFDYTVQQNECFLNLPRWILCF